MIFLALGKKGSGKSALVRKVAGQALRSQRAIFCHDPQAQYAPSQGRVFHSAAEWVADPYPPFLSIFRECDVDEVCKLAVRVRDITVVIDEMDRGFRNKQFASEGLRRIVHEGRHHRTSLLGTFRRTANVSEDLLSQTDYVALFRTTQASPFDLRTIEQRFGEHYADAVQHLEMGQFLLWQDG